MATKTKTNTNTNINTKSTESPYKPKVGRPPVKFGQLAEVGYSGIRVFNGRVKEEFLPRLQGASGIKVFKEMSENDPVVSAMLFAVERVILQASWQVVAGGDSPEDIKAAEFIKSCMEDMSHSWEDFISEIISFLIYGWAYFEVVYKIRKDSLNPKNNDGRVGWRKFAIRSQDTLDKWEIDEYGGVNGMWQCGSYGMGSSDASRYSYQEPKLIPIEKSLLFRTKIYKNNPEGKSLLRGAYRPWFIKKTLEEIEAIGMERDLTGLPVLTPPEDFDLEDPENSNVKIWAQDLVTSIRRDEQEGVLMPPGWTFELIGSPGKKQFDTDLIINRYNKLIAMTMLAQFLMLGMDSKGGGGSYALSTNQSDLFMLTIIGWMNSITETINKFAVGRLLALNPEFKGLKNPPTIQPVRITAPNLDELSSYLFKLARVGLIQPDEELSTSLRSMALLIEKPKNRDIQVARPVDGLKPVQIMANPMAPAQRTVGGAANTRVPGQEGKGGTNTPPRTKAPVKKKRGRPSKVELEKRAIDAAAKKDEEFTDIEHYDEEDIVVDENGYVRIIEDSGA